VLHERAAHELRTVAAFRWNFNLERPVPGAAAVLQRLAQLQQEALARNVDRAERLQVVRRDLAVDQRELPGGELTRQEAQGELGSVAGATEHGFAKEGAAERHAVKAADQRAFAPDLRGMREAARVQLAVGLLHLGAEPGAAGVAARRA